MQQVAAAMAVAIVVLIIKATQISMRCEHQGCNQTLNLTSEGDDRKGEYKTTSSRKKMKCRINRVR